MKELTLEERKQILLDILKDFHEMCEKNNLIYYLAYGSLLGAVRHNGYIPWDDDVDVWMPIEDIEKLRQLKLDGYYYWDCKKDKNYPLSFGKFQKNDTLIIEETYSFSNLQMGINIDIFPLYRGEKKKVKETYKEYRKLSNNYIYKSYKPIKGDNIFKNTLKYLMHISKNFIIFNKNANSIRDLSKSCLNNNMDCVYTTDEFENIIFDKNYFNNRIKHKFENLDLYIPERYHEILTLVYDDYMTPPKNTGSTHKVKSYIL